MIGHVNEPAVGPAAWSPPRWVAPLFGCAALALVPWVLVLGNALPEAHRVTHWALAWAGLDAAQAAALAAVAACAWRRSAWLQPVAAAAATLVFVDAWFDATTASPRMAAALVVDVPLGVACLALARWAARRPDAAGAGR
jgi:hypothetical protein